MTKYRIISWEHENVFKCKYYVQVYKKFLFWHYWYTVDGVIDNDFVTLSNAKKYIREKLNPPQKQIIYYP